MDQALLNLLVCPVTHTKLRLEGDLLISEAGLKYPLRDGLPVLLPDAAIPPQPFQSLEEFKAAWAKKLKPPGE